MEHRHVDELNRIADVRDEADVELVYPVLATYKERMIYWADLLAREPGRPLVSLNEIEFVPRYARARLRMNGSAIEVAFQDPVLRANGLQSDTFGAARAFFGLSQHRLHKLVCACVNGVVSPSARIALKVRREAETTFVQRSAACVLFGASGALLAGFFYMF